MVVFLPGSDFIGLPKAVTFAHQAEGFSVMNKASKIKRMQTIRLLHFSMMDSPFYFDGNRPFFAYIVGRETSYVKII
jgi:hypothetical protein